MSTIMNRDEVRRKLEAYGCSDIDIAKRLNEYDIRGWTVIAHCNKKRFQTAPRCANCFGHIDSESSRDATSTLFWAFLMGMIVGIAIVFAGIMNGGTI